MKKLFHPNNQLIIGLLGLLILILFSSCGKQKSHTYRIINNSNYDISQLTFSGAISGEGLSINTNDTSQYLTLSYERQLRLTPKLICISIDGFAGSNSFNTIHNRPCAIFSNKDVDNDLNTIVITSENSADTLTFNIILN